MRSIILMCLIGNLTACTFFGGYDELEIKKENYLGKELRTDGYYFNNDGKTTKMFFLYRNGVILTAIYYNHKIPEVENRITNGSLKGENFNQRHHWGVFKIEGNQIYFEKWAAYDGYKPAFMHSGKILNDTIFVITSVSSDSKLFESPKYSETHKLYHFRPLIRKPDSINEFIK